MLIIYIYICLAVSPQLYRTGRAIRLTAHRPFLLPTSNEMMRVHAWLGHHKRRPFTFLFWKERRDRKACWVAGGRWHRSRTDISVFLCAWKRALEEERSRWSRRSTCFNNGNFRWWLFFSSILFYFLPLAHTFHCCPLFFSPRPPGHIAFICRAGRRRSMPLYWASLSLFIDKN